MTYVELASLFDTLYDNDMPLEIKIEEISHIDALLGQTSTSKFDTEIYMDNFVGLYISHLACVYYHHIGDNENYTKEREYYAFQMKICTQVKSKFLAKPQKRLKVGERY